MACTAFQVRAASSRVFTSPSENGTVGVER